MLHRCLWPVLGLAVLACRSEAPPPRLVPAAELPEKERAAWRAYQAGGAAWEIEREAVRADPEVSAFLVDNLVREMVLTFDRSGIAAAGQGAGPFERARAELVELDERSTPVLVELVRVGDGVVAFLAGDVLASIGVPAIEPVAALLEDPRDEVRRRSAELLAKLPSAGGAEPALRGRLVRHLAEDGAWIVRAQCARTVGERGAREEDRLASRTALTRGLSDPDPKVREVAAEALGTLGERGAIPALIDRLEKAAAEGEIAGMRAAETSLRRLSGADRGSAAAWRAWWSENRGKP